MTITTIASEAARLQEIRDRADTLHEEREAAIRDAFALIEQLVPVASAAIRSDGQMRAVCGQLGITDGYHDARERIVKRLHGRLGFLRPYIPFESDPESEE